MFNFFKKYKAHELIYNNSKDASQEKFSKFMLYFIVYLIVMIIYFYSILRERYDFKIYILFGTLCVTYVMIAVSGKSSSFGRFLKMDSLKTLIYQYLYYFISILIMLILLFVVELMFNFLNITVIEFIVLTLLTINYFNFLIVVFYNGKFIPKIAFLSILVIALSVVLINYFKDSYFIVILIIVNLISFIFNIVCIKYILKPKNYTK